MRSFIHSSIAIFSLTRLYSCQPYRMCFVKNNRNMTNINENDFTELSFPSSIYEIGAHIADKKMATRPHNGVTIVTYMLFLYKYNNILSIMNAYM